MATTPNTQSFSQWVQSWVAAAQAACTSVLDFQVGSALLAVAQACSGVALWLQAEILVVLGLTRAATSQGSDLDSWMADFGFMRIPAQSATGIVTFSRLNTSVQAVVPVGAQVSTTDGSEIFAVTLDTTNPNYSSSLGGYVLAINTSSINVAVSAVTGGVGGNVQANTVTVINTSIPGVDTVNNAAPFTGGANAESDAAFRARFVLYLQSLQSADNAAISYAIETTQAGIDFEIVQNQAYPSLTPENGFFFVVIDNGTGNPPNSLLTAVSNAINVVRGCGIEFQVVGPQTITVNVSANISVASGYTSSVEEGIAQNAVQAYIQAQTLGITSMPNSRIAQVIYDSSPGITNVTDVLLNGGSSDLSFSILQLPEPGTIEISAAP